MRLPVDLPVAQRALAFAALAEGRSELLHVPQADSLDSALALWRALGVTLDETADAIAIEGVGLHGLRMPSGALDCGRSWEALALLAGVLGGQYFGTRLTVHPSLAARSVEHIVGPLRARGAHIAGRAGTDERTLPSIAVAPLVGAERLLALDASLPYADSDAKSAVLMSALFAAGATTISEPTISADHTERLLVALGLPLRRVGTVVAFDPSAWDRRLPALGRIELPGSTTIAAYLAVAAQLLPGSDITLRGVGINPTRSGALEVLRQWGGPLRVAARPDAALREPLADMRVSSAVRPGERQNAAAAAALRGGVIGGELLVRARDEVPAIALLGAATRRGARLCDLGWLESEPDPEWLALDALFAAFGLVTQRSPGELILASADTSPGARLALATGARDIPSDAPRRESSDASRRESIDAPRRVDARDDPRLSLCACTLGLASPGVTVVEHAARALRAVYPGFLEVARALGAEIEFV